MKAKENVQTRLCPFRAKTPYISKLKHPSLGLCQTLTDRRPLQLALPGTLEPLDLLTGIQGPTFLIPLIRNHRAEEDPRMKDRQAQHRNRNHHAVEHDEVRLALHDRVRPPFRHLRDTEHAAHEDGEEGDEDRSGEELEFCRGEQVDGCLGEGGAVHVGAVAVVGYKDREHDERGDLPGDTGHHEIVADLLRGFRVCCRGDAAACALQDEGEQITEDEDPGVELGADAGVGAADGEDEVFEREVDARGDEGGRDDQAADLDVEAVLVPWVVV